MPGFIGHQCQTNINECDCNPCQNGGSCYDGVNYYTCQCASEFTGTHCQTNINVYVTAILVKMEEFAITMSTTTCVDVRLGSLEENVKQI